MHMNIREAICGSARLAGILGLSVSLCSCEIVYLGVLTAEGLGVGHDKNQQIITEYAPEHSSLMTAEEANAIVAKYINAEWLAQPVLFKGPRCDNERVGVTLDEINTFDFTEADHVLLIGRQTGETLNCVSDAYGAPRGSGEMIGMTLDQSKELIPALMRLGTPLESRKTYVHEAQVIVIGGHA